MGRLGGYNEMTITITGEALIRLAWHMLWFGYGIIIGILVERFREERN